MHSLLGIEDTMLLENFGHNGHSRVDRVGDDKNKSLRAVSGNTLGQITDDTGIDLQYR